MSIEEAIIKFKRSVEVECGEDQPIITIELSARAFSKFHDELHAKCIYLHRDSFTTNGDIILNDICICGYPPNTKGESGK